MSKWKSFESVQPNCNANYGASRLKAICKKHSATLVMR